MVINQGDVFWVDLDEQPTGSGYRHPHVVIQNNVFNLSEHIGTLAKKRIRQILDGIKLLIEPREIE